MMGGGKKGIWQKERMRRYFICAFNASHCYIMLSTSHVSDSEDSNFEPTQPLFHALEALCLHFQNYAHLHDLKLLHNEEHYASICELIWLNRVEISEMWRSIRELEHHMLELGRSVEQGFLRLRDEVAELNNYLPI
jgi:hypothetical protein